MPDIVYFEVPANDVERAKKFYSELFAWEFSKIPEDDYWMIKTGGEDAVGGGLMKRMQPQQTITSYIDVESIRECAPRVENAGGKSLCREHPLRGWAGSRSAWIRSLTPSGSGNLTRKRNERNAFGPVPQ